MSGFEYALIAIRFVHYSSELFLFGGLLFPLYSRVQDQAVLKGLAGQLEIAAALAAGSALAWLACVVVGMSGDAAALQDPDAIWLVLLDTDFGWVWSVHFFLIMLLATTLVSVTTLPFAGPWASWCVLLSASLLVTQAMTGHAVAEGGWSGGLQVAAHALHLLAAGLWLGGLLPLAAALKRGGRTMLAPLLRRFSNVALPAVLLLVLTGLASAYWLGIRSAAALVGNRYGLLLEAKVLLFVLLLSLAALNRFRLLPRLAGTAGGAALGGLRSLTRWEIALVLVVLGLVSWFGTLPPPIALG